MALPLLLAAAPAIISAGKGVYDMISGGSKYNKAKKEMDALATPFYKIQNEYTQNRNVAANRAGHGFGAAQLDYLTDENERGLGAGISALSQGGGAGANDLAKILDTYSRTAARTAAEDAELQTQQISQFFNANKDLAGQKTIQWHENEYQPWANKQSLLANQMGVAKKTQDQGWNSTISGISGALSAFTNDDMQKAMLAKKEQQYAGMNAPQAAAATFDPSVITRPMQVTAPTREEKYRNLMYGEVPSMGASNPLFNPPKPANKKFDLQYDIIDNIWK